MTAPKGLEPVQHDPYRDHINRLNRRTLLFGGGAAVIAVLAGKPVIESVFGNSDEQGQSQPDTVPGTEAAPATSSTELATTTTLKPEASTTTVKQLEATTTTSSTEAPSTTEALPKTPELKITYNYQPGELIGAMTIAHPGAETTPFVYTSWFQSDNPHNPQVPLTLEPNQNLSEYYNRYMDNGPVLEGQCAKPGTDPELDASGNVLPGQGDYPVVIAGHNVSHSHPFKQLFKAFPGDIITFTYNNESAAESFGWVVTYEAIEAPVTLDVLDPNVLQESLKTLRGPVEGLKNSEVISVYNCWPAGDKTTPQRLVVHGRRTSVTPPPPAPLAQGTVPIETTPPTATDVPLDPAA